MLVSLAEQHREDVLADAVPPEVVAAVAARETFRVQIHPVRLAAAPHAVAAPADALDAEREGAFEPPGFDPAGGSDVPAGVVGSPALHGPTQFVVVVILRPRDLLPRPAAGFPRLKKCDPGWYEPA